MAKNGKAVTMTKSELARELSELVAYCKDCQGDNTCENYRLYCQPILDHAFREDRGKPFDIPFPKKKPEGGVNA